MTLGDFLEERGLSLRAFAKACGVSASSIHRVRNGQVFPNRRLLEAIHRETDGLVTPNDLADLCRSGEVKMVKTEDT